MRQDPQLCRLMQQLHSLLRRLQPQPRRQALQRLFSQPQRLALERWIILRSESGQAPAAAAKRRRAEAAPPASKRRRAKEAPQGLVRNVQSNGCYYSAEVGLDSLRLFSRASRDAAAALRSLQLLSAVREQATRGAGGLEERLRGAVAEALQGLEPAEVQAAGLRFRVHLRPPGGQRPLSTAAYSLTSATDLEAGLKARARLLAAKGPSARGLQEHNAPPQAWRWRAFREAYLEAMAERGCLRSRMAQRLDAMEVEQQQREEKAREAWNRAAMAREERRQRAAPKPKGKRPVAGQAEILRRVGLLLRRWARRSGGHARAPGRRPGSHGAKKCPATKGRLSSREARMCGRPGLCLPRSTGPAAR